MLSPIADIAPAPTPRPATNNAPSGDGAAFADLMVDAEGEPTEADMAVPAAPGGDATRQLQGVVDEAMLAAAFAAAGVGADADTEANPDEAESDGKAEANAADTSRDAAQADAAVIAVVLPVAPAQQPIVTAVTDAIGGVESIAKAPDAATAAPSPGISTANAPAAPTAEQAKLAAQAAKTSKDSDRAQPMADDSGAADAAAQAKADAPTTAPKADGLTAEAPKAERPKAEAPKTDARTDARTDAVRADAAAPVEPAQVDAAKAETAKAQPDKISEAAHRAEEPAPPLKKAEAATPSAPSAPQPANAGGPTHTPAIFHLIAGQDIQVAGAPATSQQVQIITVPLAAVPIEIAAQAREGNSHFEIRLDPPELGRIDVRLDVDSQGKVTSHLTVERVETLDLLKRDAPQLERALQDAGLKTGDSGLQFSLRDQNFAGRDNQQQPRHGAQNFLLNDDEGQRANAAAQLYGRPVGAGGVDIRV